MINKLTINAGTIGESYVADTMHVVNGAPAVTTERPVKALFLMANPVDTERVRVDEECREIEQAIRSGRHGHRFEVISRGALRLTDLQTKLHDHTPELVHFAGHGARGSLVLEDPSGRALRVEPDDLRAFFELLAQRARCVVLNACGTAPLAELLVRYVPCVIGMSHPVGDPAAIAFSVGFYKALANGESVRVAFDLGASQFRATDAAGGGRRDVDANSSDVDRRAAPVLHARSDPSGITFS